MFLTYVADLVSTLQPTTGFYIVIGETPIGETPTASVVKMAIGEVPLNSTGRLFRRVSGRVGEIVIRNTSNRQPRSSDLSRSIVKIKNIAFKSIGEFFVVAVMFTSLVFIIFITPTITFFSLLTLHPLSFLCIWSIILIYVYLHTLYYLFIRTLYN